jgi:hypothetical protein
MPIRTGSVTPSNQQNESSESQDDVHYPSGTSDFAENRPCPLLHVSEELTDEMGGFPIDLAEESSNPFCETTLTFFGHPSHGNLELAITSSRESQEVTIMVSTAGGCIISLKINGLHHLFEHHQ